MPDTGALTEDALERAAGRFGLQVRDIRPLSSITTSAPLGEWRTLIGPEIDKAVRLDLKFDDPEQPVQIQSMYAMCRPATLAPHLMVEWSANESDDGNSGEIGLLVDLIPRLDLGVNLPYVDEVFVPLDSILSRASDIEGVKLARIPPRRATAMSPWALSVKAPAQCAAELAGVVDEYIDHWIAIVSGGVGSPVDPVANDPARLVQHDRYQREALFHEESDPIWPRIYRTIGPNEGAELRMALRSQETR